MKSNNIRSDTHSDKNTEVPRNHIHENETQTSSQNSNKKQRLALAFEEFTKHYENVKHKRVDSVVPSQSVYLKSPASCVTQVRDILSPLNTNEQSGSSAPAKANENREEASRNYKGDRIGDVSLKFYYLMMPYMADFFLFIQMIRN